MTSKELTLRNSGITVTLPLLKLTPQLVFLPGIVYKTTFSKDRGNEILKNFKKLASSSNLRNKNNILRSKIVETSSDKEISADTDEGLSDDAVEGAKLLSEYFPSRSIEDNSILVGCLPGFDYPKSDQADGNTTSPIKVVTVSRITDVIEYPNYFIISFKALTRGLVKSEDKNGLEAVIEVERPPISINASIESKLEPTIDKIFKLFSNVETFVSHYSDALDLIQDGSGSQDKRLNYILMTLIPIAGLLYGQLSSSDFDSGFEKLNLLYVRLQTQINSNSTAKIDNFVKFYELNDILTAIFPFTTDQKISVLSTIDSDTRLLNFEKLVDFSNNIFEKTLNTEYISQMWKNLDIKNGLTNGDFLRSQFVSSHLRSLRALIQDIGGGNRKNSAIPSSRRLPSSSSSSRNQRRGGSAIGAPGGDLDEEDEDYEIKEIKEFIENIDSYDISEDGARLLVKDFKRMQQMQTSSSDYQLLRTYLEIIVDIPWVKLSNDGNKALDSFDLSKAKETLDKDHYGLESVKERILEYIAVLNLHEKIRLNSLPQLANSVPSNNDLTDESMKSNNQDEFVFEDSTSKKSKKAARTKRSGDDKSGKRQPKKKINKSEAKAPILLLSGPPGVGKTSLARSIASSLGRNFQRISLGGLKDESEIKGHRRTYIGAMPGLIVQALRRSQCMNPVILLDEIDKVSSGGGSGRPTGDPAAALLEVLDPEQNLNFHDHYIGFPIDLSQVVFICTANDMWELSDPLRDRMEVIELSGYNYFEKLEITKKYLIPRQIERNGLNLIKSNVSKTPNDQEVGKDEQPVKLSDETILKIAVDYTGESGIRELERLIGSICRSKAIEYSKLIDSNQIETYDNIVTEDDLAKYVGTPPHLSKITKTATLISKDYGVVNGLSYNSDGSGSTLTFEMIGTPGGSNLNTTGRLGEVLLESSEIANSIVSTILNNNLIYGRINSDKIDCTKLLERYKNLSVHMHVPQGSVSKDGPSAGITMTLCLLSLILEKAVPDDFAMTGEITLRGLVLPIGGVNEKLLGAHLSRRINRILLPRLNRKDLIESFIDDLPNREVANLELSKLIKEEEELLNTSSSNCPIQKEKRLNVFGEPEKWIQEKLGLHIYYIEEFSDAVKIVWDNEIAVNSQDSNLPVSLIPQRSRL